MAPRIRNPLSLPAELLGALAYLPSIAQHTASMAKDTKALAGLRRDIATVADRTEGITTIDARMAHIEQQLDVLTKSIDDLQRAISPLATLAGRIPGGGSRRAKRELERELARDERELARELEAEPEPESGTG